MSTFGYAPMVAVEILNRMTSAPDRTWLDEAWHPKRRKRSGKNRDKIKAARKQKHRRKP